MSQAPFRPSPDVAAVLHNLLDQYERRHEPGGRAIRCDLEALAPSAGSGQALPGYYSQRDPEPRRVANDQFRRLEAAGAVTLTWLPGEANHLLESVTLNAGRVPDLFALLDRDPLAERRARLRDLLLADRFRLDGWRLRAVGHALAQLQAGLSPTPFSLSDDEHNRDLLAALVALGEVTEETPMRVFSVRLYNDSKRFEALRGAIVSLARRHQPDWRELAPDEALRELGLVANPDHLRLFGPWRLVDARGVVFSLADFEPSVGIPTRLAAAVRQVTVEAERVICVENMTSFYELIRRRPHGLAALYLGGNPSPACRHLLSCLAAGLPAHTPLGVWADLDYGGLNILAQLRRLVHPRFMPYLMDEATLDAHVAWAKPLTPSDERSLARLARHPSLADVRPVIKHLLARGFKLEQEAITP